MKITNNLKKLAAAFVLAGTIGTSAFAREGFSLSGFWKSDSLRAGGALELGFPTIYEKGNEKGTFFIRDGLELGGAGIVSMEKPAGNAALTNKVFFGAKTSTNGIYMKSYGFTYAGCDLIFPEAIKGKSKGVNYGFDFGGGGGFEIGFESGKAGFVVEYGGGCLILPEKNASENQIFSGMKGYNNLTLGFRQYF